MALPFDTDAGIGTRANFGVIVLQTDETIEHELQQITGMDGVALYHSRIPMHTEITSETLRTMEKDIPAAAGLLPNAVRFDAIGYGCTSAATVIGPDRIAAAVQCALPGVVVTNPISAVIAACRALRAKRIGFVTPYVAEVSEAMRGLLESEGFEISAFGSFEESDDRVVARISPASLLNAIEQIADMAQCDVIFVSCTNLRVASIADTAEAKVGVPVISSNLALGWHMLRLAGVNDRMTGFGRLFHLPLAG